MYSCHYWEAGPELDAKVYALALEANPNVQSGPVPAYSSEFALAAEAAFAVCGGNIWWEWQKRGMTMDRASEPTTHAFTVTIYQDQFEWSSAGGTTLSHAICNALLGHVDHVRAMEIREELREHLGCAHVYPSFADGLCSFPIRNLDPEAAVREAQASLGSSSRAAHAAAELLVELGFEEVEPGWWKAPSVSA